MDLSMILSPAVDAEPDMAPPAAAPAAPRWNPDEVECAVGLLHDLQAPVAASAALIGRLQPENGAPQPPAMSKLDLLVQADAAIETLAGSATGVRSGVWTRAEEEYAAALMYYFLRGELEPGAVREGTTLRKFLAEKLGCNRRRVSMKLATEAIAGRKVPRKVGASVFVAARPPEDVANDDDDVRVMHETLADLRRRCFSDRVDDKGHLDGGYRHYHRDRSGSLVAIEHYPPHHRGDPLEEILDHPPQYRETSDDEDGSSALPAAANASAPPKRAPRRSPLKKRLTAKSARAAKKRPTIIRTGFESREEEEYVTSMVEFFLEGALALPHGTPLVEYLCEQLGCSARALSLKLAPRRASDPKRFPDNMGEITFRAQPTEAPMPMASAEYEQAQDEDDVSDEIFEVEARLGELRVACLEAHEKCLQEAPLVRITPRSVAAPSPSKVSPRPTPRRVRSAHAAPAVFSRSGAWSREEEEYTAALIDRFFKGTLDIAEGTTLRAFLASKLQCNPMRVSKKLASECIADVKIPKKLGSSTFVRQRRNSNAGEEASEYPPQVKPEHQISFEGKVDRPLRELERAFQRVDSAKHYARDASMAAGAHSLKSPVRGRRRKLPLSPSLSSPGSTRTLFEEESEDERLRRQVQQAAARHFGSHSSSDESDADSMSKIRRTDYSRSPAAEAARARAHAAHDRTTSVGSASSDGGPTAFESHIVPFSLREQVA